MLEHLQSYAQHFADGLFGAVGLMAGEEQQLGDMARNIVVTVLSLLIVGGVSGSIVAWSQAEINEEVIQRIENTQTRILDELKDIKEHQ